MNKFNTALLEGRVKRETAATVLRHEDPHIQRITLPQGMPIRKAITWLKREAEAEEQIVSFERVFDIHPTDGAYQLWKVLEYVYGFVSLGGSGMSPPQVRSVKLPDGQTINVPWGTFEVPDINGKMIAAGRRDRETGNLKFVLAAQMVRKDQVKVEVIADLVQARIPEQSIYHGQAVRVTKKGDIEFLSLSRREPGDLILNEETKQAIMANIFTPIQYTQAVRDADIPLKRGVLLHGEYGTGKTLCGTIVGNECVRNGWTYFNVKDQSQLIQTIHMARVYSPSVVYCEDIDHSVGGERTQGTSDILETIDGVLAKGSEVMLVFTTNNLSHIHGSFLRPGRLDALIEVEVPGKEAAAELIRRYGGEDLGEYDPSFVGSECEGMIPAALEEVANKSKLFAITNNPDRPPVIGTEELVSSARVLKKHLRIVRSQGHDEEAEFSRAKVVVGKKFRGVFSDTAELLEEVKSLRDNDDDE